MEERDSAKRGNIIGNVLEENILGGIMDKRSSETSSVPINTDSQSGETKRAEEGGGGSTN